MSEIWKTLPQYPNYQVSSFGRVRHITGRLRKLDWSLKYAAVQLSTNGTLVKESVHILICEAFHGPKPFKDAQALHRDDIKSNNTPDNLYWGTHQDNMNDVIQNKCINPENSSTNLDWSKVRIIRARASLGESGSALGREFGLTPAAMNKLIRSETWKE